MFDESKHISLTHEPGLDQWTHAWYDEAVQAEFIHPPYHPDTATLKCLRDYFDAGLSPAEAAQACFGRKH
ncbi:hypothetical protein WN982_07870 [Paraburkholderia sp. IMGN_8]|uniref:hypothetical protein n=1 Tax=Paraburkholderia sp. IMGN_8 TaxID=3136564 RepID=UPI0031011CCE